MAYDQGSYQPPQRPYNGRAAQRPGPPQSYNQAPPAPQQQYPPPQQQQYDQYGQDGSGYDDYNNGYAQDYNGGYDMNGGGAPRNNGYPPQDQGYNSQQQDHYGDGRGGMPPGGGGGRGGPPPRQRGPMDDGRGGYGGPPQGRGPPPPRQRPAMDDGMRGGYDPRGRGRGGPPQQRPHPDGGMRGGYANGGPNGRGGAARPGPPDRSFSSDPGQSTNVMRKPLKTPPLSPEHSAWDNPFPTFPGAKKKTSVDEERNILQKMESMNVSGSPPQNRPKTAGSKSSQTGFGGPGRAATFDDYGRPSGESQRRGPSPNDYGQPSGERQRLPPQRTYTQDAPPQQGYNDPRRGPPGPGYGAPAQQNAYGDPGYDDRDNFGPPSRSMTMPNSQQQAPLPRTMDGPGPSAPYNGPVGRNMPPRPATATGAHPQPQRNYRAPEPAPQQYDDTYDQGYSNSHRPVESISEFYDSYYDDPDPVNHQSRHMSDGSELPNFDAIPNAPSGYRRGASIDGHIAPGPVPSAQPTGYQKPVQSQADYRAHAQPQAAVIESASDGQRTPTNGYFQNSYEDYGSQNGQYNQPPSNQRQPNQGGGYGNAPQANGFQPPPRSTSAAPRTGQGYGAPPAVGPKPVNGLPNGPHPMQQAGMPRNNSAGSANSGQRPKLSEDALPSHPIPVRAGLIPGSVASQNANTKPIPVRNYDNVNQVVAAPVPQQAAQQAAAPAGPQPLTVGELEHIRNLAKASPNDGSVQMLLIKKLVEASEVLVSAYPDQRMRNKMREKYVMEASKMLKRLVSSGNPEAMFYLADCYGRGALGLESNDKEAFTLYQSAAKAGNAAAAYRTAVCCELGNEEGGGTRKDPTKAIQWYKRAATLGDTPAMYKMGMILLKGLLGQAKNSREAVVWLKRAAERADAENPHALHELGLLFEAPQTGDSNVVRDEAYSFSLFQQASDLGYKFSQFRMGCAYEYGLFNCTIDPRQSIAWYSRAAVQEEHQSELALSGWYLTGSEGVLQQSDTEAYLWARKAAMAGLAKAEYAMGYFTEVGIGCPSSLEDAKRWYWRAAAQDFPKARERLEELKRNGGKGGMKSRERISRSKVGKHNEGGSLY